MEDRFLYDPSISLDLLMASPGGMTGLIQDEWPEGWPALRRWAGRQLDACATFNNFWPRLDCRPAKQMSGQENEDLPTRFPLQPPFIVVQGSVRAQDVCS